MRSVNQKISELKSKFSKTLKLRDSKKKSTLQPSVVQTESPPAKLSAEAQTESDFFDFNKSEQSDYNELTVLVDEDLHDDSNYTRNECRILNEIPQQNPNLAGLVSEINLAKTEKKDFNIFHSDDELNFVVNQIDMNNIEVGSKSLSGAAPENYTHFERKSYSPDPSDEPLENPFIEEREGLMLISEQRELREMRFDTLGTSEEEDEINVLELL